jgi:hypothetical protein
MATPRAEPWHNPRVRRSGAGIRRPVLPTGRGLNRLFSRYDRHAAGRALRAVTLLVLLLGSLGFQAPTERAPASGSPLPPPAGTPSPIPIASAVPTLAALPAGAPDELSPVPLQVAPGLLPAPQVDLPGAGPAPTPQAIATPTGRPESDDRGPRYAGWAMEAYPTLSANTMEQIVARQRGAGANVVWIGHNNPGEVSAQGAEPGLSYAVYEAFVDANHPQNAEARAIVAAQERLLGAIRAQGLKAVLPVGYQSQMGTAWSTAHPDALRTESRGGINRTTAVVNASFYSPDYQRDVRRYYEWVDARFVQPYRDTILMVNLADEPSGGDYSTWADAEFKARTGYGFADVGDDATRIGQLGQFQTYYVADYAAWSAGQWAALEPDLPTTMSFEGATARIHFQLPQVEAVFARTPSTFYPTFDAYPRDGPPDLPLDDVELIRLFTLVRSLGHYSAHYNRPFWLWSTANSWGLSQTSPQPANVADAVANGYYLALLARQSGGWLQGIAAWNYNIVGQGLYNDTNRTAYDPDTMFARVSESLSRLRQIMASPAGAARVLLLTPTGFPYRLLGASRTVDPFAFRSYDFHRLAVFARNNVPAAVVTTLAGEPVDRLAAIVVLSRYAEDLPADDAERLRGYLARGGTVIAPRHLSSVLGSRAEYVDGDRAEEAFADSSDTQRRALWQRAFGVERPIDRGFYVATADDAILYTIGGSLQTDLRLPFAGRGWLADPSGYLIQRLDATGGRLSLALDKSQYAYLTR